MVNLRSIAVVALVLSGTGQLSSQVYDYAPTFIAVYPNGSGGYAAAGTPSGVGPIYDNAPAYIPLCPIGTGTNPRYQACAPPGGGSSGVSSFNNRTGAVSPASGDYTASQVGAAPATNPTPGANNYAAINGQTFTGPIKAAVADTNPDGYGPSQITACDPATPTKCLRFGINTSNSQATIQGVYPGQYFVTLGLNVNGGSVVYGHGTIDDGSGNQTTSGVTGYLIGTIASAATIAPTTQIAHITGTTAIATITPPGTFASNIGGCLTFIADGAFSWTTAGNIQTAGTATANTPYQACWGGAKWFIK